LLQHQKARISFLHFQESSSMQLVAPDILEQARGLSISISATGLALGCLLWIFGWSANRFWIAFFATVAAGVFGLQEGPAHGVQPLIAGLLLAVVAGVTAVLLVRLLAYFAGGVAGLLLVHVLVPHWDEPVVCILAGGLLGVALFRFWVMALTSCGGTMLMVYSGLCLLDALRQLDMMTWAKDYATVLNWTCGGAALVGLIVQFLLERARARRKSAKAAAAKEKTVKAPEPPKKKSFLKWSLEQFRQAG
jgi:hypothetical protein